MKILRIDLNSKRSLIDEIVRFNDHSQIHSKRTALFQQNQQYFKDFFASACKEVKTDTPTKQPKQSSHPTKKTDTCISNYSLNQANIVNNQLRNNSSNNVSSRNVQNDRSKKIDEYDLNGERDFMYFNITEYDDKKLNRVGSKHDGKILEKTLKRKKFQLKAYLDGLISEAAIRNKLKSYVDEISRVKRNVKVLIIAFMAHGAQDDRIVFSDESTCRYISLLEPIFECKS